MSPMSRQEEDCLPGHTTKPRDTRYRSQGPAIAGVNTRGCRACRGDVWKWLGEGMCGRETQGIYLSTDASVPTCRTHMHVLQQSFQKDTAFMS
jgi:hypothetical protein